MENKSEKKECEMCKRIFNIQDLHYFEIEGVMAFPRRWTCLECQEKFDGIYK